VCVCKIYKSTMASIVHYVAMEDDVMRVTTIVEIAVGTHFLLSNVAVLV
jgi:hypothetical protein